MLASLINKFKASIIAYLITSNNSQRTPLLSIINFLIDLIANVISALLDEEDFATFLQLVY